MGLKEDIKFAEIKLKKLLADMPPSLDKLEGQIFERLVNSKRNDLNKLEHLYDVMGKFSKFIDSYTPCKNHCSKCCHIRVDISEIEIQHIEKKYKIKRNKNLKPNTDGSGSPCVFLKNDTCSIYEGRPFMCRSHFFYTPDETWCAHDVEVEDKQEFPLLRFTEIDKSYFHEINKGDNKVYDIREVFGGI